MLWHNFGTGDGRSGLPTYSSLGLPGAATFSPKAGAGNPYYPLRSPINFIFPLYPILSCIHVNEMENSHYVIIVDNGSFYANLDANRSIDSNLTQNSKIVVGPKFMGPLQKHL